MLAPSMPVAAVVLAAIFAPTVQARAPHLGLLTYVVALGFAVMLFASVLLHELAHGFMARARGQHVREFVLTVWGGHTAFGAASPTPGTSALVAVVGPLANLAIAGVFWVGAQAVPADGLVGLLLYAAAFSNGFVGLFNLVPGLPLDGGRMLEALVWRVTGDRHRGATVAGWGGRVVALGVVGWAVAMPLAAGTPPSLYTIIWAALIGSFLWSGAGASIADARTGRALSTLTVASVGLPATVVGAQATLADADRARGQAHVDDVVVLAADGRPAAYIDRRAAAGVAPHDRARTPVTAVSVMLPAGALVDAHLEGGDLVHAIGRVTQTTPVVVAVDGMHVVALIRAVDVIAALHP